MAEPDRPVAAPLVSAEESSRPEAQSSWFKRAKLLLFALAVVVAECLIAYLLIPAATPNAAIAATEGKPAHQGPSAEEEKEAEQLEVDLGKFGVTSFQPSTNSTLLIDFHLFGTVAAADREGFTKAMEENMHRFRDQVIVTVRSAELSDLTEAGLSLLKRKILQKGNKLLGKPYLRSVVFSDYSFVEQ